MAAFGSRTEPTFRALPRQLERFVQGGEEKGCGRAPSLWELHVEELRPRDGYLDHVLSTDTHMEEHSL